MAVLERVCEQTFKRVGSRPLSFEAFLDQYMGQEDIVELIDGVVVERDMVQLDHEKLFGWLYIVLSLYARAHSLGIVLGSRTAVRIGPFRGRLPDLLFVRRERMEIVQQAAVHGAPDLVIEIVSPGDRPSDVIALETDYRAIGVAEIVFLDQRHRRARVLRRQGEDYAEEVRTEGAVTLETLENLRLELDWLFDEPRPDEMETLNALRAGRD